MNTKNTPKRQFTPAERIRNAEQAIISLQNAVAKMKVSVDADFDMWSAFNRLQDDEARQQLTSQ